MNINNNFTDDLFDLNQTASKYLLKDENILFNLEQVLKEDTASSEIIEKYKTLSNLLSLGSPGPGWLEISSPIYFWNTSILLNRMLVITTLNSAITNENNKLLKTISEKQIPELVNKLDKVISIVETIPKLVNNTRTSISNLLTSHFSSLEILLNNIDTYLKETITDLLNTIIVMFNDIVQEFLEKNKVLFEEKLHQFSEDTSEKASLKIVGESYYKWDSENIYAPTLTFLFEENITPLTRKRSRISIKLPYTRETLPENIVEILKEKVQSSPFFEYTKGNIKCIFIHPTKKWRTTFFVKTKREAKNILRYISSIGDIECLPEGLSYTEGRKPLRYTQLTTPLPGVDIRERTNEGEYRVKLSRVVLLLSNSSSPIVIWKNTR